VDVALGRQREDGRVAMARDRRAVAVDRQRLIGGSGCAWSNLSSYFEPAAAVKNDHDGTTPRVGSSRRATSIPDRLNIEAFVRQLRARYELLDAAPTTRRARRGIAAACSLSGCFGAPTSGAPTRGPTPTPTTCTSSRAGPRGRRAQAVPVAVRKRTRFIRFRLRRRRRRRLTLRNVEIKARPSGRE
jgi:hypothetical protein